MENVKRHLHFNCFSGAGGDMLLSALVDLGADPEAIGKCFHDLDIGIEGIRFEEVMRAGMRGKFLIIDEADISSHDHHHDHADVHAGHSHEHSHEHEHAGAEHHSHEHSHKHEHAETEHHSHEHGPHRHLKDMLDIVERSCASLQVKDMAARVLKMLAWAEGRIHGKPADSVHFHELSGIDTIVDVLGSCLAFDMLGVETVSASMVTVGRGTIRCAHGIFTVPAPATLEILAGAGIPYEQGDMEGELLTPTGAALLAVMVNDFGPSPAVRPERTGYGAGTRDFDGRPNLLQAVLGTRIQ